MHERSVPIIGIFGSKEDRTPALAEKVGYELARRRAIVLTGGRRPGEEGTPVKNRALAGVGRAAQEAGVVASWIGVPKEGERGPTVGPRSFVFNPGYGDRRNYLEALLSDAAVCFIGGAGTASELAFCVAVGRPVILVDYPSGTACPIENREARALLVEQAQKRVGRPASTDSPIDRCIVEAYDHLGTDPLSHEHVSSGDPSPDTHIAERALELAGVQPFPGTFPDWPADTDLRDHYRRWLATLSP